MIRPNPNDPSASEKIKSKRSGNQRKLAISVHGLTASVFFSTKDEEGRGEEKTGKKEKKRKKKEGKRTLQLAPRSPQKTASLRTSTQSADPLELSGAASTPGDSLSFGGF